MPATGRGRYSRPAEKRHLTPVSASSFPGRTFAYAGAGETNLRAKSDTWQVRLRSENRQKRARPLFPRMLPGQLAS